MRTGILCLNLGSPEAPTPRAIRPYLKSFLDDPRVISLPTVARKLLINGLILPFRPYKVAKAYQAIWDKETGSPLVHHSKGFSVALQDALGQDYVVALGMRHGQPGWEPALESLLTADIDQLIVFPLFPQYASATTGSLLEVVLTRLAQEVAPPGLTVMNDFFEHEAYIQALAQSIRPHLSTPHDKLLLSYHGLPERDIQKVEEKPCARGQPCPSIHANNRYCYRAQCYATSRALVKALGLSEQQYEVSFQSRLGRIPWIAPYTDERLRALAEQGVKRLLVACPSFVADCLETLEEIGMAAQKDWQASGGETLTLIPCLNAQPTWVQAAANLIRERAYSGALLASQPCVKSA